MLDNGTLLHPQIGCLTAETPLSVLPLITALVLGSTLNAHAGIARVAVGETYLNPGEDGRNWDTDPSQSDSTVIVYLVRHAEKADDGTNDPPLTIAGQIRGQTLARLLKDADVQTVFSTDLKRTRETGRPLADTRDLELEFYDPSDLQSFAETVRSMPGTHLVVGHSNTTPVLVDLLGGDPEGTIDEMEYDRLYMLVFESGRPAVSVLLRYGEPYVPGTDFGLRSPAGRLPQQMSGFRSSPPGPQ